MNAPQHSGVEYFTKNKPKLVKNGPNWLKIPQNAPLDLLNSLGCLSMRWARLVCTIRYVQYYVSSTCIPVSGLFFLLNLPPMFPVQFLKTFLVWAVLKNKDIEWSFLLTEKKPPRWGVRFSFSEQTIAAWKKGWWTSDLEVSAFIPDPTIHQYCVIWDEHGKFEAQRLLICSDQHASLDGKKQKNGKKSNIPMRLCNSVCNSSLLYVHIDLALCGY